MAASQSPPRRSRELGVPLLSEPPEKSSQSLPSPRSPAALRAHPACDRAFLSLAPDPVWSLQTQQIPAVRSRTSPPGGGRGVSPDLPLVGSLLEEQWPDCAADHGLWQPRAESPLLGSVSAAGFPARTPGSSAALRHPRSFCDPEGPETTLSREGSTPHFATRVTSLSGADF